MNEQSVSREKAIQQVGTNPEISSQIAQIEVRQKIAELDNGRVMALILAEEKGDIVKMRRKWSNVILWCIVAVIIFDMLLVPLVGFGAIRFEENTNYLVGLIITENLAKILGLAYIVVNYLFSSNSVGTVHDSKR